VENRGALARRVHLVADASADSASWADRDVGHSADHRTARDHDCRLAAVRDFRWEEGRDSQLAKDVGAECRVARKRQPQAGQFLADPAVVGRARRDAAKAQRRVYLGRLGVKAVRVELAVSASVRVAVEPEAQPERMDVELVELQDEPRLERQVPGLKERSVQAPVLAPRLAQKRLALIAFESAEFVV
jgi:hypothetical protein